MCGICGYINYRETVSSHVIDEMTKVQSHRGPDDLGTYKYKDNTYELALGHVRLSILDLSTLGHQPMTFQHLTIVYNGEIYNYKEIRLSLIKRGHSFVSNCDTEVILHAFYEWGIECVNQFIGMFAFAIFDKNQQKVYLFRDRAGVKPLYYYVNDNTFIFASEIKSFVKYPYFERTINYDALMSFMTLGYIPCTQCIFEKAHKLESGRILIYDLNNQTIQYKCYWDIQEYYNKPKLTVSYEEAQEHLLELFKSAFGYRMVSDVPVGLFLSGGYDSSLVASILTQELNVNLNTFTIGFSQGNNEAPDAEQIASHLKTNHISYYCTPSDAMDIIPNLPYFYDEPFSDSSAIPTILVSKLSKEKVSVVLSADGGDEEFAGYNSYSRLDDQYKKLLKIPSLLTRFIPNSKLLLHSGSCRFQKVLDNTHDFFHHDNLDYKSLFLCKLFFPDELINVYDKALKKDSLIEVFNSTNAQHDSLEFALVSDYKTYMKDDVLVKVDRATMSVSIEGREPLIDHRISEYAAQLPLTYKYYDGIKKRILRDIVHRYIPQEIMNKPKRGFSMPIDIWLREPLKDYLMDTLSYNGLKGSNLQYNKVQKILSSFLDGNSIYDVIVWRILQYQAWYNYWMRN